ncbi:MAG TPA: helix-turn-helix domain-containing protein [Chitinophagales bacterium]|nr:helix-turn-helix domain-containing protein [Chitinophagales bacterium]
MKEGEHDWNLPKAISCLRREIKELKDLIQNPKPTEEPDKWFNLQGLREYIPGNPVPATIYGYVSKRIIPFHKKGRELFFLKSEIDAWLKEGRHKTNREIEAEAESYLIKSKGASHE